MYALISKYLLKVFNKKTIFKHGFNLSPMYRRSTGKLTYVSDDLHEVKIRIRLSYKNSNYVGSIFGGSLFSATDPVLMVQLINILGDDYVVWDKESTIKFKQPAKETVFANFLFTEEEVTAIKNSIKKDNELDIHKVIHITDKDRQSVYAEVSKIIYVADKSYYKNKRKKK
ncbi:MAG: DUF4442 domain-containing protein [Flavobacteriaceae bacterium]